MKRILLEKSYNFHLPFHGREMEESNMEFKGNARVKHGIWMNLVHFNDSFEISVFDNFRFYFLQLQT